MVCNGPAKSIYKRYGWVKPEKNDSIEYEKKWHPEILLDPEKALPIEIKKLQDLNDKDWIILQA